MLNKIEEVGTSQSTFYELLGGAETGRANIRELVEKFYDIMETDARAAGVRAMHPADLTLAREKLFMFLTGWTGGPQLYVERYGHPMLRRRHLPFAIDESARDQWMSCMIQAMISLNFDTKLMENLGAQLHGLADFMRNQ